MTDDQQTDEETAPAQTVLELPDYHGTPAVGMKTSLAGVGKRITRSHEIDEKVVLLVEAVVKSAGHEGTEDGLVYVEKLKTVDLFEISGEVGRRLLGQMRSAYRSGDDAAKGKTALALGEVDLTTAGDGTEVTTDGSGVVLTREEIAELRSTDPLAAAEHPALRPAVIVFSDNSRDLWPDDYEENDPRPSAGDRFDGDDPDAVPNWIYVKAVLHHETGETLEEWTEEAEAARMLEAERELEAQEAGEIPPTAGDAPDEEIEFVEDADGYAEPITGTGEMSVAPVEDLSIGALAAANRKVAGIDEPDNVVEGNFGDGSSPDVDMAPWYTFVDRQAPDVIADLPGISEKGELDLVEKAEQQGRGRGLKPRKGLLAAIEKRAAEIFLANEPVTPPPPDGAGLEPGDEEEL